MRDLRCIAWGLVLGCVATGGAAAGTRQAVGPAELRVDDLKTPLGIDDAAPRLSWQLQDPTRGARQTAYELLVASRVELLEASKADLWDSGRIESGQSLNVRYAGRPVAPSTRSFWRVKVWGANGKLYPGSTTSWWETGLLKPEAWQAKWIGYETAEEDAVRHAPAIWIANPDAKTLKAEKAPGYEKVPVQRFAYRLTATLTKPVRSAALYATAEDTVSAWINGTQLLESKAAVGWGRLPWKKFVRADATGMLTPGANSIAIEAVRYVYDPENLSRADAPQMLATLVVEYIDGTTSTFVSGAHWKTAVHAASGWQSKGFDDSNWKPAVTATKPPEFQAWIPDSVKALRSAFTVSRPVKSARLYATALGAYELFLNGKRVGDDVMAPGWTDYRQRVYYQTYDVTAQLSKGSNAVAALLAPGWYSTSLEWYELANNYGNTPPALRAQLRIEYADGTVEWVATGASWQAAPSPILHSEIYDGESQDARLNQQGWNTAAFSASNWSAAQAIDPKPLSIEAQDFPPIRVERTLNAKSVNSPKPGVYVYDFGQNFSGVTRLRVHGPAGTEVRLRFAEILNSDGTVYTENLRNAKATDRFILSGSGANGTSLEEFTPQFTFHGFRYVELTGLPTAPTIDALTGIVFHTDAPFTANLNTGSSMINQLWSNIQWGQRSNFVGVPTDCPQRDERLGWAADAQVFWRAASYNMDLAAFSRKYAADFRGTQVGSPYYGIYAPGTTSPFMGSGAGWSDAGVIVPWTSWLQTGDVSVIDQNWAAMEKYLAAIAAANPDGLWKNESGIGFGDWLSPEGSTDYTLITTAYWAYDVTLMRQMAHATGRTADEQKYASLFEKIRAVFQAKFVHADGFVAGADPDAKGKAPDTQTGYVLALHMNLVPENLRQAAAQKLVDKIVANHERLGTGFLGTPYLLEELTKAGHARLAYTLLLNTDYPSWGYMVEHGATTMWERWNGDKMLGDPGMNSFNHYAYGAVADWIDRYAAGVDATPLDAGFHTVVLHPTFDARLGNVTFDYSSSFGQIHSDWTVKGRAAEWHLTLPANTTGWLPLNPQEAAKYKLGGVALTASKQAKPTERGRESGFELTSGSYSFAITLE